MVASERWRPAHRVPLVSPFESTSNVRPVTLDDDVVATQHHRITLPGSAIRIAVSNEFGRRPTSLSVSVGLDHNIVRFDGLPTVTLLPGRSAWSDPCPGDVARGETLVVSIAKVGAADEPATYNPSLTHTTTLSARPAGRGHTTTPVTVTTQFHVAGIDVLTDDDTPLVVAVGDSITAGFGGTDHGFPAVLTHTFDRNVLNLGIAGNRVMASEIGPSVRERLARDALAQLPELVVIQAGINDLANLPPGTLTSRDGEVLACALLDTAATVAGSGADVVLATLPPVGTCRYPQFRRQGLEAARAASNDKLLDGPFETLRVDELLADPHDHRILAERYDSGDGIHPNDAAASMLAGALDRMLSDNVP